MSYGVEMFCYGFITAMMVFVLACWLTIVFSRIAGRLRGTTGQLVTRPYAKVEDFKSRSLQLRDDLQLHLDAASGNLHNMTVARAAIEASLRFIEMRLIEQDKMGFVTSGSELDVLMRHQVLNVDAVSFTTSRFRVDQQLEKARCDVIQLQELAEEITAWSADRSVELRTQCNDLIAVIGRELSLSSGKLESINIGAEKSVVGIDINFATPKVMEFRREFERNCSARLRDLQERADETQWWNAGSARILD